MIEEKSINNISKFLGQYMTPIGVVDEITSNIDDFESIFFEPSFGTGNFIKSLLKLNVSPNCIYGYELDTQLYKKTNSDLNLNNIFNKNFYDCNIIFEDPVHFIGNVPFRSPAMSLNTHKDLIKHMCNKYNVKGIREEAVFFILKTLDIIENSRKGGRITYIIPKSLITNNSKFFTRFQNLLNEKFNILSIVDLPNNTFDGAALNTCVIDMVYDLKTTSSLLETDSDYWKFNTIFKNTYLGSVPCESIFLSPDSEPISSFKERLIRLYTQYKSNPDEFILENLKYNGVAHLKVLNSNNDEIVTKKIKIIRGYLDDITNKFGNKFINYLRNESNYKQINHRKSTRFYFRNKILRKCDFVYELNPNPRKSFYFTGNPSSSSTDYFGYCDYDITRNSSPGACRTIPLYNLEENLTSEFKLWWNENIELDYYYIFDIFSKTYKSEWYSEMKNTYDRFYFGIPFDGKTVLQILNSESNDFTSFKDKKKYINEPQGIENWLQMD